MNVHNLAGMTGSRSSVLFLPTASLLAVGFVCIALWAGWSYSISAQTPRGAKLYAEHCATCHGAQLEGQPDSQVADESGVLPAPPHDASGHTWHHDDAMLTDYIRRGGQAVLGDIGVPMTSGMPAFGEILTDGDIAAILGFIKSTWPDRIRAIQAERNGS